MRKPAITLLLLALAVPFPASAEDVKPEEMVRQVLLGRNADLRANLMRVWLVPPENADATRIRGLTADVYSSEARLMALGVDRTMMREGTSLAEVPYFVLADRAKITIDPWTPLAGKSFVMPKDLLK